MLWDSFIFTVWGEESWKLPLGRVISSLRLKSGKESFLDDCVNRFSVCIWRFLRSFDWDFIDSRRV